MATADLPSKSICPYKTVISKDEIEDMVDKIASFHVIIKFGRFIEGQTKHYDTVLGVELASENQYAEEFWG